MAGVVTKEQERSGDVRLGRVGKVVRVLVALAGIGLLINGSVRASDDAWPFGPMSQYAGSVPTTRRSPTPGSARRPTPVRRSTYR